MKKIWKLSLVLTALMVLTACSSSNSTDKESDGKSEDKITTWAWDPTFNIKALEEADKRYEGEKSLNIVPSSQEDIIQKLNTALTAGNKDGLPSIVLIEDYKAQGFLESYPDAFEDLSDIIDKDAFAEYKFASSMKDGKYYGVPFDSGVSGLFYRTDYLAEAGYAETDLENITWDQFYTIGKAVKEKTGKPMLSLDPSDLGLIRIIMQSSGEWYTGDDGNTVTIAGNDSLKSGIDLFTKLIKEGIAQSVSGWDPGVEAINTGAVASTPNGSWYSSSIMQGEDQSGSWRIAPIPRLDNGTSVNASSIGGCSWWVLKGVGDTKAAKEFLKKTFASDVELMNGLVEEIGLVSTLKAAETTEAYNSPIDFYSGQEVYKDFSNWMNDVPSVNYGKHTNEIEAIMTEYVQRALDGENIDDLLKEAQSQIESTIG